MYGLCKIHNLVEHPNDIPPFHPILLAIGSYIYGLAKFFVPLLKEYTIQEYSVKDSFPFCKEVSEQDSDLYMAPFDSHSSLTFPWMNSYIFEKKVFLITIARSHDC